MLHIDVKYRDHFLVNYVYGFNASDFAYFAVVQKKSHLPGQEEMGHVTRLARTCISDANYDSYTEVTLQCGGGADGHASYNLLQVGVATRPGPPAHAALISAALDSMASVFLWVGFRMPN